MVRIEGGDGQRIGLFSAQPRFGETAHERGIIGTVGLQTYDELLILSVGVGPPGAFLEEILDRKVVELYADGADEHAGSPAARYLEFVAGRFYQRPADVDQVVGNGLYLRHNGGRVEVLHLGELPQRLHEQGPVVELARTGIYLAAYHFVVHALVTAYLHIVDGEGSPFEYFDFQINRVFPDHYFGRLDDRHQVSVVLIKRRNLRHVLDVGFTADAKPFVERLFVVGIALFDTQHGLQQFGRVLAVAYPRYVADVEFVAFLYLYVDADAFVVDNVHRIPHDDGIAVSLRIVEVEQILLVLFVIGLVELETLEDVGVDLMRLFQCAPQSFVREDFVSLEIDGPYLHPFVLVHDEGDIDRILYHGVVLYPGRYFRIAETLAREVFLNEFDVLVYHVVGEFRPSFQFQVFEQGVRFALANPFESPSVYPRSLLEVYLDVHHVVGQQFRYHLHVGKITLVPKARYRLGDGVARYVDRFAPHQSRRGGQYVGVEVFDAENFYIVNGVWFGVAVVHHRYPVGTVQRGGLLLGVAAPDGKQKEGNEEWYRFSHYSWLYNYLFSFLFLFIDFPESPMAAGIRCDSRIEIVAAEIGPVCRGEVEFAVCSLPEQEIAQTLFSAGADYQVGVGDSAGIEFAGYRFGSYLRGGEFA